MRIPCLVARSQREALSVGGMGMRTPFIDWRNEQESPLLVIPLPWRRHGFGAWLIVFLRWPLSAVIV